MSEDQRKDARVAVELEVILHVEGVTLTARTENLSLSGAMLSLEADHGLSAGRSVRATFRLPGDPGVAVDVRATVRWASELLPELVGIEFDAPLGPDVAAWLAR